MTVTLDDVQTLADQLSPQDQARLIEHLSRQRTSVPADVRDTSSVAQPSDALAKLMQLRADLAALPATQLASEQLSLDRAERQATLEGTSRVHP